MTVSDLQALLARANPNDTVFVWNPRQDTFSDNVRVSLVNTDALPVNGNTSGVFVGNFQFGTGL